MNSGKNSGRQGGRRDAWIMARSALCVTLVFVGTRALQFPIPLGYAHLGNTFILLAAVWFGPETGALAGGLGSALADLTSFPAWTLPTLFIKTLMGLLCGLIAGPGRESAGKRLLRRPRVFLACAAAAAEMTAGYFLFGSLMAGSFAVGALQIPGLCAEGALGIVLFYILGAALERTKVIACVR